MSLQPTDTSNRASQLQAIFDFQNPYLITGSPQRLTFGVIGPDGSYAATVPDTLSFQITKDGTVKVHRMVLALNCGHVVNPDQVAAQVEGSVAYGLSAAMHGDIRRLPNGDSPWVDGCDPRRFGGSEAKAIAALRSNSRTGPNPNGVTVGRLMATMAPVERPSSLEELSAADLEAGKRRLTAIGGVEEFTIYTGVPIEVPGGQAIIDRNEAAVDAASGAGVVAAVDAPSIYDIPKVLHREGLDAYVVRRLGLPFRDVEDRKSVV